MVATYTILGRQIGSHWLAIGTLGGTFGLSYWATRSPAKKSTNEPPINAQSKEEESFVKDFLKKAETDKK